MPNHTATLRALVDAMPGMLLSDIAQRIREIATDLEKAQASPLVWKMEYPRARSAIEMLRMPEHVNEQKYVEQLVRAGAISTPLFAAQPPAIPISPPQEWVDFLLDDSSDKGNCSLAEFRAFANRAWGKMRSILKATEPKAVVASQSKDAEDASRYRFLRVPNNAIVYAARKDAWGSHSHPSAGHVRYDTPEQLDIAIDAAIAAETKS